MKLRVAYDHIPGAGVPVASRLEGYLTPRKNFLNPATDDGIVVGRGQKGDVDMLAGDVPEPLRERLGPEGTDGLLAVLDRTRGEAVTAALTACTDRFERRLVETSSALRLEMAGLRQEVHEGFAAVRQEMRDGLAVLRQEMDGRFAAVETRFGVVEKEMHGGFAAVRQEIAMRHADQLRWSFLFWVGQVAVLAGLFGVLLRAIG